MDCLNVKQDTKVEKIKLKHRMLEKTTWFLSVSRNATVVIACTMLAYIVKQEDGSNMLLLTGEVASGLPTFKLPKFSTEFNGESYNFIEMISYLNSGLIVVPLVAIIANISIAKAFCKEARLNATTEIIALGACNFVGAFASAFPSNGAFSRSALCHASGAKTPATGLVTGLLVLFTLWFLTPFFYYIPKAALASVIVCAVLHMVNLRIFKDIWNNNNKLDLVPLTGTILACLALDVVYGIMVGVAIDIAILLYFNASPKFDVDCAVSTEGFGYIKVTPGGGLFFPSYGTILDLMDKVDLHGEKHQLDRLLPIVIDCKNLHRVDWTTVQGLKMFVKDIKRTGKDIIIMGLKSNLSAKLALQLGKTIQFCQGETALEEALRDCRLTVKISE